MYVLHRNSTTSDTYSLGTGCFLYAYKGSKKQIDYSPAQTLIIPRFVSPHIMKTKQHIKSAADFSAICWCCKWIRSLNRAVWQSPCVPCFTVSWWRWGRAVSCLITVTAELKWSMSRLLGGWQKDRGIAHFAEQITGGGGVGRYYEEWWAGVGGSLRCKVLHLVPHRAVKRWRPNRWQNSPSETSHRLSISTQFKTVWASVYPLISSTCSVRTEHEIWDKYYWYCSNELFITLDSRCLL